MAVTDRRPTVVERLAASRIMARFPPAVRSPFALNNLVYFAGNMFAGLAGFVFQSILAGSLGPTAFGEVATLLAIFYLIQIAMFVAMAIGARYAARLRVESDQAHVNRVYIDLTIYASVFGFAVMVLFVLLSPVFRSFLHLPGYGPLIILSAAIPLSLLVGVGRGVVQGEERFLPLSLNFVLYGVGTLMFLPVLLSFRLHAVGAMLAINLALVLCNLFAAITLRDLPHAAHHARMRIWPVLRTAIAASAGITMITLFYNMDVLLAKHFLSAHDAGLYAVINLLGRILFFGTISASAVMFPRVAALHAQGLDPRRLVNISMGLVVVAGGAIVAVYTLAPGFAIRTLLRRPEYQAIAPYLWRMGLAMLGLALANVLVYYFVAVHHRRFALGLLVGASTAGALLWNFHSNLDQFTMSVTIAIDSMALVLLAIYLLERRHAPEPAIDMPELATGA